MLCAVPVKELKAGSIKELDLAGKSLGTEGALVLATYLKEDSRSLASLNLAGNDLRIEGAKIIAEVLPKW